jgi:AbrB family looped-hinge helix DNA binding protein
MATKTTIAEHERVGRVGQRRQIVIPRDIFDALRMQEGDFVAFSRTANGVLVKPKRPVDRDDVLAPAEAKTVRRGEAQLKRGQSKSWRAVKNALPR